MIIRMAFEPASIAAIFCMKSIVPLGQVSSTCRSKTGMGSRLLPDYYICINVTSDLKIDLIK
jgi:hypothetical protein